MKLKHISCSSLLAILLAVAGCAPVSPPITVESDVVGKVIVGYQAWFNCAGDGSPVNVWKHWVNGGTPGPGNLKFELYPDTREYTSLFNTNFANLGNGQPTRLFSSYSDQTISLHFQWMRDYGLDGAALQRFGTEITGGSFKTQRDNIAVKVKNAAAAMGRKFYIMYDISGMSAASFESILKNDWTGTITGTLNLTASPAYARHDGKPVVCIWGLGFINGVHPGDATQSMNLVNWFKSQGCYVIGGVPTYWRECINDSKPGFQDVYKTFDMIQPWLVGRVRNNDYKTDLLSADWNYCKANGIDYAPVLFPGFAWSNWNGGPQNEIPRNHGDFFWQQAYNTRSLGIPSAYIAMFDEYDEGTAIAKAAEDASMKPTNQYFLTLDADGTPCSSDFYLRLAGDLTKMIKGVIPLTATHPTAHQ
ncbi:MAG: glycoside hydrolase family 71/99-like protein [Bacteroidota bacterium]